MSESNIAFNFDDSEFMDFLPENDLDQLRSRWTDFNIHDPGVTTFEALQFSFEDLNYRYSLGVDDLLQGKDESAFGNWTKRNIRSRYAVSVDDYRRILHLSASEILNCNVAPVSIPNIPPNTQMLNCLLDINIATSEPLNDPNGIEEYLLNQRALGEYFNRQETAVSFLNEKLKTIDVKMEIRFFPGTDTEINIQTLRRVIEKFLLPKLESIETSFNSEQSLLNANDKIEHLHQGTSDRIISPEVLGKESFRRYIVVGELYEAIQHLNFIMSTQSLEIAISGQPYRKSILDMGEFTFTKLGYFELNDLPIGKKEIDQTRMLPTKWMDKLPPGKFKNLGIFNSVQLSFPPNYKLGRYLINDQVLIENNKREKCTYNFRGYLYFMDQIRADVSAQMGQFPAIFKMDGSNLNIAKKDISTEPFYQDILLPEESDIGEGGDAKAETLKAAISTVIGDRLEINRVKTEFDNERINYLLALNGWSIVDEIPSFRDAKSCAEVKPKSLIDIKKEFLRLIRDGGKKADGINKELNEIFKASSLILLQEKLNVILQNDFTDVRIIEHCFLQPVWDKPDGLNFEITIFLFQKTKPDEGKKEKVYAFINLVIRAFVPAHIVVNTRFITDDVRTLDGYLQTAFPPNSTFYFDQQIEKRQEHAMRHIMNSWLNRNA